MDMRRARRRWESQAEAKLAMARAMIEEADRRWQGMAAFLERTGMDQNAELVSRLAHRAERRERRARYLAEARTGQR
jgi:hypothetical protein